MAEITALSSSQVDELLAEATGYDSASTRAAKQKIKEVWRALEVAALPAADLRELLTAQTTKLVTAEAELEAERLRSGRLRTHSEFLNAAVYDLAFALGMHDGAPVVDLDPAAVLRLAHETIKEAREAAVKPFTPPTPPAEPFVSDDKPRPRRVVDAPQG